MDLKKLKTPKIRELEELYPSKDITEINGDYLNYEETKENIELFSKLNLEDYFKLFDQKARYISLL
jgi:hypothetical protein